MSFSFCFFHRSLKSDEESDSTKGLQNGVPKPKVKPGFVVNAPLVQCWAVRQQAASKENFLGGAQCGWVSLSRMPFFLGGSQL